RGSEIPSLERRVGRVLSTIRRARRHGPRRLGQGLRARRPRGKELKEMDKLDDLVTLSRRFGSDPDWVLAGGGNTSFKDARSLYVKASGSSLGTIDGSGFCAIDRTRLDAIWSAEYPEEADAREVAALADLMAARMAGEAKRPSVETLMHGLFPQAYV